MRRVFSFVFLLVCALPQLLLADGKFFSTDVIPLDVPYQRAVLSFDGNSELLLLQSKYEWKSAASTNALGWVVPVPAVPELGTMKAERANDLLYGLSAESQLNVFHVSEAITSLALITFFGSLVILTIRWVRLRSSSTNTIRWLTRTVMDCALGILLASVLLAVLELVLGMVFHVYHMPFLDLVTKCVVLIGFPAAIITFVLCWVIIGLGSSSVIDSGARNGVTRSLCMFVTSFLALPVLVMLGAHFPTLKTSMTFDSIEVVKEEQVGAYDVKVVKSTDSQKLTDWLNANSFRFGATDTKAFDGYIRRGWCFVVAKLRPERMDKEDGRYTEGLVDPFIFKFAAQQAIYPLALTATTGRETEILLYVLGERKMECGGRLEMTFAGRMDAPPFHFYKQSEFPPLLLSVNRTNLFLTKFTGRLTAQAMAEDLVLRFASDNRPFRKRVFQW